MEHASGQKLEKFFDDPVWAPFKTDPVVKEILKAEVKDVRLSERLRDSACCLVTDEGGMDPNMEKLLKAMGQEVPQSKRILEINPGHPVIEASPDAR